MLFSKFLLSLFSPAYTVPTFLPADLPLILLVYGDHASQQIPVLPTRRMMTDEWKCGN